MKVYVNGVVRELPEGLTFSDLLDILKLHPKRVAVECNKHIVRRAQFADAALQADDKIEIVTLVGGG
jgi:thiamine biosynthesis protein ThiS